MLIVSFYDINPQPSGKLRCAKTIVQSMFCLREVHSVTRMCSMYSMIVYDSSDPDEKMGVYHNMLQ